MRRKLKVLSVLTALAVPASLATVVVSGPASASTTISCTSLKGNLHKITVKGTKCTARPPHAYKNLVANGAAALAGGGTMTWSGGHGANTITISPPTTGSGDYTCPANWSEADASGTVTAGTDSGSYTYDTDLVGSAYAISVCLKGNKVKLAPGSTVVL